MRYYYRWIVMYETKNKQIKIINTKPKYYKHNIKTTKYEIFRGQMN